MAIQEARNDAVDGIDLKINTHGIVLINIEKWVNKNLILIQRADPISNSIYIIP